jgi:hypothetical protein
MLVKLTRRWEFLKDAQKKGAPLARSTLVTRCLADVSVLEFICNMAYKQTQVGTALSQHRLAVNFYTVMMVDVLELAKPVPEAVVTLLLRHISKGVKAKECPEYRTASYMLSARLCTRVALSEDVASALASELTSRLEATDTSAALSHALLPLLCIFQTQTLPNLPDKAFAALAQLKELPAALGQLGINYDMRRFMGGFLRKLCVHICRQDAEEDAEWEQHFALFQGLVAEVPIGMHVPALADMLLAESLASGRKALRSALLALDTAYPEQVTSSLRQALNDAKLPEDQRKGLVKLVTQAFSGTRHEMLAKAGTTLLLALDHPLLEMRLEGISQVREKLEAKKILDPAVAHAVLGRLGDTDHETVVATLELPGLVDLVDAPVLLESLLGLLEHPPGKKPSQRSSVAAVTFKQLSLLSKKSPEAGVQEASLPAVLAHLAASHHEWKVSQALLEVLPALVKAAPPKSAFQQLLATLNCKALLVDLAKVGNLSHSDDTGKKKKKENVASSGSPQEVLDVINRSLVESLGASIAAHPTLVDTLLPVLARSNEPARRLVLCAIVSGLRQVTDKAGRESLSACLSQVVQVQWRLHVTKEVLAETALASLSHTEAPIPSDFASYELLLSASLQAVLETTSEPPLTLLRSLYVFFVSGPRSTLLDQLLTLLFQRHFEDLSVACDFLRPFWSASWANETHCDSDMGRVPLSCVVSSFHVVHAMVKVAQQQEKDLALEPLLASLTVGTSHRSKAVRHAALSCLKTLEEGLGSLSGKHAAWLQPLLTLLVDQHEELLADGTFLSTVFARCLSGGKGDLSKELQHKVLDFLLSFVRTTGMASYLQWVVFSSLAKVPSSVLAEHGSMDLLDALLSQAPGATDVWSPQLLRLAVRQLDADTAKSERGMDLLIRALESTLKVGDCSVRQTALGCIDARLFTALSAKQRSSLFDVLAVRFRDEDVAVACQNCLKRLNISEGLLGGKLQKALAVVRKADPAADRVVVSSVVKPMDDDSDDSDSDASEDEDEEAIVELSEAGSAFALKEATHTLELVQFALQQSDVTGREKLILHIFQLLTALMREELQQSEVEYPKQLSLACLLGIFRSLGGTLPKGLSKKDIDLGVVVSCVAPSSRIRGEQHGAQRSQTRNHALLLLSCMADLVPELVLKVLVPIFANIYGSESGSEEETELREDDSYTFSVIQQTIETVIPPLAKHGLASTVTPLVSIFAAAARQMSAPRALRILTVFHSTLASSLSGLPTTRAPASHLHECVALLAAYQLRLGKEKKAAPKNLEALHVRAPDTLLSQPDFCHHLLEAFSAGEQTATLARLLHVLDLEGKDSSTVVLTGELRDESARGRWKVNVMRLVASHLVRPSFAEKVRRADVDEGARVRETFLALFQKLLQMLKAGKSQAEDEVDEEDDEETELLKLGMEQVNLALSRLNKLLSVQALVAVASELLVNDEEHIRRKGLQLLRDKARHADLTESDTRLLLTVLPRLEALVMSSTEEERTVVLALESVQVMCDALSPSTVVDCKADFLELLPKLVQAVEANATLPRVAAAGLRCVGGVCRQLSTRSLKHLAAVLNAVLSALERTLPAVETTGEASNGKRRRVPVATEVDETSLVVRRAREVRGSALGALDALVEEMAKFCTPHLPRMLTALLHPRCSTRVLQWTMKTTSKPTIPLKFGRRYPHWQPMSPLVCSSHAFSRH